MGRGDPKSGTRLQGGKNSSRTRCLVRDGFGAKCPGTIRRTYQNAPCCMEAYISHLYESMYKQQNSPCV